MRLIIAASLAAVLLALAGPSSGGAAFALFPSSLLQSASADPENDDAPFPTNLQSLGSRYDCLLRTSNLEYCFDLFVALDDLDRYWKDHLAWITPAGTDSSYTPPKAILYYHSGNPQDDVDCTAPLTFWYCTPAYYNYTERYIAINEPLLVDFHSKGDFGAILVLAHEWGHHIQNLLGRRPSEGSGDEIRFTIQNELQADCYAGLWSSFESRELARLEQGDLEEALAASYASGDHRLQRWTSPRAHGLPEQRVLAFRTGFRQAGSGDCSEWRNYFGEKVIFLEGFTLALSPGMVAYPSPPDSWIVLGKNAIAQVKLPGGVPSERSSGDLATLYDAALGPGTRRHGSVTSLDRPIYPIPDHSGASYARAERFESSQGGRTEHGILYILILEDGKAIAIDLRSSGVPHDASWFELQTTLQRLILGLGIK